MEEAPPHFRGSCTLNVRKKIGFCIPAGHIIFKVREDKLLQHTLPLASQPGLSTDDIEKELFHAISF